MTGVNKESMLDNDAMLHRLKHLVDIAFYSLIPFALFFLGVAILSNSLVMVSSAFDFALSIVVQLFAHQSIRAIMNANVIKFPYGTGKVENFSAFLYGALSAPTSLYLIYASVARLLAPAQSISFSIVQLAMIPAIARALYLFVLSRRLNRQTDSPMAHSYYINFKITTLFSVCILAAFTLAMVLTDMGHAAIAGYIDPAVSLCLSFYKLYNAVKLTGNNFKILMDLPLPEDEQLKIMSVLTREFANYEDIGNIYTRRSGRQRFLDIELYFDEQATISETARLQARMQSHLEELFSDISFKLIARPYRPALIGQLS